MTVKALESVWHEQVAGCIVETATRLVRQGVLHGDVVTLRQAQHELSHGGFLQCGDLLFIAGSPPRLGYVIPPHYSRTFHRQSKEDLAMAAPLTLPPTIGGLEVYQRTSGRWAAVKPPRGICLGEQPANGIQDAPGLALAAYLRWAAWRVASNGRFHEHDT